MTNLKSLLEKYVGEFVELPHAKWLQVDHLSPVAWKSIKDFLTNAITESAREGFEAGGEATMKQVSFAGDGKNVYKEARKQFFGEDKECKEYCLMGKVNGVMTCEKCGKKITNKDQQIK